MGHIVLIIGNGFDLNVRLPTSFGDFIRSDEFSILLQQENSLCKYLHKECNEANWFDVEGELVKYSMQNPQDVNIRKEYVALESAFYQYIKRIESMNIEILSSHAWELFMSNVFSKINSSEDIDIINFNYTDTIRRFFKVWERLERNQNHNINSDILCGGLPKNMNLIYPHGSINDGFVIIGVEDSALISSNHSFLKKTSHKNFKRIPPECLKGCDKIIFFGHSLGVSDHTYFKDIFENSCRRSLNLEIIISYYGEDGYDKIMEQLNSLTDCNVYKLKILNKVRFVDVSSFVEPGEFE